MSSATTAPPKGRLANCRLCIPRGFAPPLVTMVTLLIRSFGSSVPVVAWTHLVVHLQRVALSSGLEVARVGVHRQVHLPVEALHVDRVPVLVVQQATHGHGHPAAAAAAAAEPGPAVVCGGGQHTQHTHTTHTFELLRLLEDSHKVALIR